MNKKYKAAGPLLTALNIVGLFHSNQSHLCTKARGFRVRGGHHWRPQQPAWVSGAARGTRQLVLCGSVYKAQQRTKPTWGSGQQVTSRAGVTGWKGALRPG